MQQSRSPRQGGDTSCAISEQHQQNRRRHGEANPGCETSQNAAPHQTNAEAGLARCWSRQELGEGDKIGVRAFTKPLPPLDEFSPEIADVGNRPAKRGDAELQKSKEDFDR
jgi:hypothetical protein